MTITEFLLARITEDEAKPSLILEQSTDSDYLGLVDEGPCPTLRALASVYADHPDYNEACSLLDGWEWDR